MLSIYMIDKRIIKIKYHKSVYYVDFYNLFHQNTTPEKKTQTGLIYLAYI